MGLAEYTVRATSRVGRKEKLSAKHCLVDVLGFFKHFLILLQDFSLTFQQVRGLRVYTSSRNDCMYFYTGFWRHWKRGQHLKTTTLDPGIM